MEMKEEVSRVLGCQNFILLLIICGGFANLQRHYMDHRAIEENNVNNLKFCRSAASASSWDAVVFDFTRYRLTGIEVEQW